MAAKIELIVVIIAALAVLGLATMACLGMYAVISALAFVVHLLQGVL